MHAQEYDVDVEDGLQFRVSIPEERLEQGISAEDLATKAVNSALARRKHEAGIRYHIQLAVHDPELE